MQRFGYCPVATPMADPSEAEDDFVAGLVEQMAHSMLDEDDEEDEEIQSAAAEDQTRIWASMQVLPERRSSSGSWMSNCSSNASPSPAVSPPTPLQHFQYDSHNDAWELLHMAAQEVMRLKMGRAMNVAAAAAAAAPAAGLSREDHFRRQQQFRQWGSPAAEVVPSVEPVPGMSYNDCRLAKPSATEQRSARPHNCYQSGPGAYGGASNRRVSRSRQQQQTSSKAAAALHPSAPVYSNNNRCPLWSSSAAPNAARLGMRAVFLRGPNSTSNGTGVFLPQAVGTGANHHRSDSHNRKPSCSTVLLPSRIVGVLNLEDDLTRCEASHLPSPEGATAAEVMRGEDDYLSEQISKSYAACSPTRWRHSGAEHHHAMLPTEWTY